MKSEYSDLEIALFTSDGNIKRYLNGEKIDIFKEGQCATTTYPTGYGHGPRTHNLCISLNCVDRPSVKIKDIQMNNLRIRKLSPLECLKLMGFSEEDYNAISKEFSNSAIYHVAGDSIITTCLMSIFGTMLDDDYRTKVENHVESLKEG